MNPNEFDETKKFLSAIDERKETLKTCIDLYKISLVNEILVRDLSEKIKNASILGIKLPKLKGYDSQMDFYTFKTEFEKLVAPRIQAKYFFFYALTKFTPEKNLKGQTKRRNPTGMIIFVTNPQWGQLRLSTKFNNFTICTYRAYIFTYI